MRKLFIIFLSVLSLTAFAQQKKVAVYVTGENENENKVLASKLVSSIARSEIFTPVERTAAFLAELNKEQNYQYSGAVDDDELSRLGKHFGVQYICVASVNEAFNERYLSARLIDVESAQVESTAGSSGAIHDVKSLINAANIVSNDLLSNFNLTSQGNYKKVAVYIVKTEAGKTIGRVLGDKLVTGFSKNGRYIAIERTNSFLSQLSKEQTYQQSGSVDDNDLSRIGKQFGVQYVCVAEISDVFGEKFVSARLIDVETAEVLNSYETGGAMNNMNDCLEITNEIASNLSKGTLEEQAEDAKKQEEEKRIAAERERQEKIQALKDRDWRVLLDTRIEHVDKKYPTAWYVGAKNNDGQFEGTGLLFWTDGTVYVGHFEKGSREGTGIQVFGYNLESINCPNGKVYVGTQYNNKKSATGSVYDKYGKLIYRGGFRFDKPKEEYPALNPDTSYTCEVIDYDNGDKYVGEMKNGIRHGKGFYIWAEGNNVMWYGTWADGMRDGYGFLIYDGGKKHRTGKWKDDTKL